MGWIMKRWIVKRLSMRRGRTGGNLSAAGNPSAGGNRSATGNPSADGD
jgi:hypothetical protein